MEIAMRQDCADENSAAEIAVTQLNLSKRARNALLRAGLRTLEDAVAWSDRDLLSLPHFGRASVASLRAHVGSKAEGGSP